MTHEDVIRNKEIAEKAKRETIKEIIDYISYRFNDPTHKESLWVMPDGTTKSEDVGYAQQWWKDCMKVELEERYLK